MTEEKKDETTPLLADVRDHISEAYGFNSALTYTPAMGRETQVVLEYEPLKFSTFRVFFAIKSTVLTDPVLFLEQVLITLVFLGCAAAVFMMFKIEVGSDRHGDAMTVRRWLNKQENYMRMFAKIMMMLTALLLTFYTSMAVSRWWTIRTGGVGGIKAATVELEMYVCQLVTQDDEVLSAIRRYARASLILVFLWRRKEMDRLKEILSHGVLSDQECEQLLNLKEKGVGHALHETIWAWQSSIVTMLYREGRIKSDQLFNFLLERCSKGREAVQLIHTHIAVKIPMQYVHLLGFLVKLHNLVLAVIMGLLFGAAIQKGEVIVCVMLFGRTLILPLLFNAILLINAELSDPFDGSETDFPCLAYEQALEKDGKAFVAATQNLPDWMSQRFAALAA